MDGWTKRKKQGFGLMIECHRMGMRVGHDRERKGWVYV